MAGQEHTVERRLAAILAADVVGSSRLMEQDEAGTLAAIRLLLSEIIEPVASRHCGRVVKTLGDGALLEFASPVEAVRSAVEIQVLLGEQRNSQPVWQGINLRIGVNLGDTVISPDGDIHGDSVNIAARLEGLADAGGICISDKVFGELEGKLALPLEDRGEQRLVICDIALNCIALAAGFTLQGIEAFSPGLMKAPLGLGSEPGGRTWRSRL